MTQTEIIRVAIRSHSPLVVGVIAEQAALELPQNDCDVIELRLDSLGTGEDVLTYAKNSTLPLLITARGPEEGGTNDLSPKNRKLAYEALMPHAAAIDIELRSFSELISVVESAQQADIAVVGSFHDFEKTPSLKYLAALIGEIADLHKFATMISTPEDLEIHRALLRSDSPLSVMGMGPLGAETRPEMMQMGSVLNYGFLGDTPTAPNQWPVAKLKASLSL